MINPIYKQRKEVMEFVVTKVVKEEVIRVRVDKVLKLD